MSRTNDIYNFIVQYRKKNGITPSIREIARAEKTSTSVIDYHIQKLVHAGRLRKTPGVARSLVPTKGKDLMDEAKD